MMAKTHTTSTLSIGLLPFAIDPSLIDTISLEFYKFYFIGLSIGAVLPDIDEPNSSIGRRTILISNVFNALFRHRGITHQFIVVLGFIFLTLFTWSDLPIELNFLLVGLSLGVLCHQLGDFLAGDEYHKGGIKDYFWPITNKTGNKTQIFPYFLRCRVGSFKEYLYFFTFLALFTFEQLIIFGSILDLNINQNLLESLLNAYR